MGWTDSSGAHSADYGKSDGSMYPDKADVARKVEQSRFRQIMAHPRVKNGTAFNLGIWIARNRHGSRRGARYARQGCCGR